MALARSVKTSFTAGELGDQLLGRGDLRAFENGARRLRNVFIQPTGGITRRPGLRHVALLPGKARLIAFEFNTEQTYLLVLTAHSLQVFMGDVPVAQLPAPWTEAMLEQIAYTQSADTLLILHPELGPQRVTRSSHMDWTLSGWEFISEPFHRFAPPGVTMASSGSSGEVTLTAGAPFFQPGHVNARLRIGMKPVIVTAVTSPVTATALVHETLDGTAPTEDWDEAAFSGARGWPVTACFHQDRLVLGGSRDLPNRLWLSRSGDLFNFDLGTGLDDQAIEFGLLSDQVNAIRAVFSGRHLQIFTSGAEWMVTGDPMTPASIQLHRQTRIGSPVARLIQPVDVDGSTIFVSRSGQAVHEYAYTEVQQAYQASDLALVARHLVRTPLAMAYDQTRRLLHVAMEGGWLATLTLYRTEQVTAWTRQDTAGVFGSLAEIDGTVWCAVQRLGGWRLERFDDMLAVDAGLSGESDSERRVWSGLGHLPGTSLQVVADGAPRGEFPVAAGAITLDAPARSIQAGLAFKHLVEPLPPLLFSAAGSRAGPLRLVAATFRLLETAALSVDLGRGPAPVSFRRLDTPLLDAAPPSFTGDVTLRGLGWRRDTIKPLWRIEGDTPLPMTLLSVTTETRMTD
ncbi:hypothetical protein [Roseomonas marmotae]|uniref:Uncharacterized protein n=1 Tax=Roseomonas marmotae TaxID=2768161 RepID=A0ABS3KFJ1_9PROT|nr:hypothetical protein [Roseomonas marmotae]MBO1075752.1 hypothetical protein [Roseomonas marmotae]QTI80481.1 hypothetical protein IAI58_07000 [Roseomonas marmotae]